MAEAAWAALVFLAATCKKEGQEEGWTRARKDLERRLHRSRQVKAVSGSRAMRRECNEEAATLGDQTYNIRQGKTAKPGLECAGWDKTLAKDLWQLVKDWELTGLQERRGWVFGGG